MSETHEKKEGPLEPQESIDSKEERKESSQQVEPRKSTNPASESNAVIFGTRKRRPGTPLAPAAQNLAQTRGAYEESDDIEMDDLPVKATAPDRILNEERPSRPPTRNRRSPKEDALNDGKEEEETTIRPDSQAEIESEPRAERFGTVSDETLASRRNVSEFRPSRDGKTRSKKRTSSHRADPKPKGAYARSAKPKKKGFFAWLKSLFADEVAEERKSSRNRRSGRGQTRRRGRGGSPTQNRGGGTQNRRRPRRPRSQGQGNGGKRRSNQNRRGRNPNQATGSKRRDSGD